MPMSQIGRHPSIIGTRICIALRRLHLVRKRRRSLRMNSALGDHRIPHMIRISFIAGESEWRCNWSCEADDWVSSKLVSATGEENLKVRINFIWSKTQKFGIIAGFGSDLRATRFLFFYEWETFDNFT